jgi:hypothetical protein
MDEIDERTSAATIEYLGRPLRLTHSQVKVFMDSRHLIVTRNGETIYAKSGRKLTPADLDDLEELRRKRLVEEQAPAVGKRSADVTFAPTAEAGDLLEFLVGS